MRSMATLTGIIRYFGQIFNTSSVYLYPGVSAASRCMPAAASYISLSARCNCADRGCECHVHIVVNVARVPRMATRSTVGLIGATSLRPLPCLVARVDSTHNIYAKLATGVLVFLSDFLSHPPSALFLLLSTHCYPHIPIPFIMKFSAVAVIVSFLVCTAVAAPVPFAGIKVCNAY